MQKGMAGPARPARAASQSQDLHKAFDGLLRSCYAQPGYSIWLTLERPLFKFFKELNLKDSGLFDALGKASVIGLHMVSGLIVGGAVGYFLDEWLGTGPWLKIIFFILGIGAGFRNVYLDTKLLLKSQSGETGEQDAGHSKTDTKN